MQRIAFHEAFPCADPQTVALSLRAEYARAGEYSPAADWLSDLLDLPFAGMPRTESLISLMLAADALTVEWLIEVSVSGLAAAFRSASECAAMEDAYQGTDRTETAGAIARRAEAAA